MNKKDKEVHKSFDIRHVEALFFDFDGVIVGSLDIKAQAFGELFKNYGKDVVKKVMDYHMDNGGTSRYEKFKYYYKNLLNKKINQKIIDELDRKYSQIVLKKVIKTNFIKAAMNFLKKLNENKKECFIISATPTHEIRKIIKAKNLKGYFSEVLGSPKNKVDNLKSLLRKYSLRPGKCFYFGDSKSDRDAAAECRVNFVGINCVEGIKGYKNFEEFMKQEMR